MPQAQRTARNLSPAPGASEGQRTCPVRLLSVRHRKTLHNADNQRNTKRLLRNCFRTFRQVSEIGWCSFNAVAFGPDPLKVVMGDGLIAFTEDIGLANNGVDLIYAHEVGHHVQGALGLLDQAPTPENTRRTELMADAFATYYLVHARGAAFNAKRALDAFEQSFIAGDCGFDSPGHHGTPNQRLAAAEWGASVAQERPRGHIESAVSVVERFDAELPIIIAPDAP